MRRTNHLRSLLALSAAAALGACLNPRDRFDDFSARYEEIAGSTGGGGEGGEGGGAACELPAPPAADGQYLFSLAVPSLGGKKAFALLADVKTTAAGDGLSVDMTLQALARLDQTMPVGDPNAADPVGDPIVLTGLPVAADGSFTWDLGTITLTGAANPISGGDIETTLILDGELCGGDRAGFVCGDINGIVVTPIPDFDLKGSFFTMQLVSDALALPAPVLSCAQDPAAD
jgi:hypothetical protein